MRSNWGGDGGQGRWHPGEVKEERETEKGREKARTHLVFVRHPRILPLSPPNSGSYLGA